MESAAEFADSAGGLWGTLAESVPVDRVGPSDMMYLREGPGGPLMVEPVQPVELVAVVTVRSEAAASAVVVGNGRSQDVEGENPAADWSSLHVLMQPAAAAAVVVPVAP